MSDRQSSLEVLRQVHDFPGPYVFKIIGENTPDFIARVVQAAVIILGPKVAPQVATRQSSGGKHQSITLTVRVADAERVLDLYDVLGKVGGVRFLL